MQSPSNQDIRELNLTQTHTHDRHSVIEATNAGNRDEQQDESSQNPVYMRAPWFVDVNVPHTPILIAESSDSAFATRFRQAISSESQRHLPRVDYPDDEYILNLCERDCPMPEPVRARYLIEAALRSLGRSFHVLLRTIVVDELERFLQSPESVSIFVRSKLLAAFAIGELYTTRASVTMGSFPGLAYFARATRVLQIVPERPNITVIETKLLLASSRPCQSLVSPY